jgi:hypothetical protein
MMTFHNSLSDKGSSAKYREVPRIFKSAGEEVGKVIIGYGCSWIRVYRTHIRHTNSKDRGASRYLAVLDFVSHCHCTSYEITFFAFIAVLTAVLRGSSRY